MSNTIRCKLTGEPIAIKLDGGWCVCPGPCLIAPQPEHASKRLDETAQNTSSSPHER